jgi:hypothetical protein
VSSSTWTPHAVASRAAKAAARLWRAVEAQHIVSTLRLVDSPDEQRVLEDILEATKPPLSTAARELDYLLFTPFRYRSPFGSRFRSPTDPGVFYGAETVRTACAELGYWRWRFLEDSAGLKELGPAPQTLFEVGVKSLAVDLERAPFSKDAASWKHPSDYSATQEFGAVARTAGLGLIRYASVRDPLPGRCGAVLTPAAFSARRPVSPHQTWFLTVTGDFAAFHRDRDVIDFDTRRWRR